MRDGVGRMTTHLSPAERVALAPGPARSDRSALRWSKCIHTFMYTTAVETIWQSYIGDTRRMESGRGNLPRSLGGRPMDMVDILSNLKGDKWKSIQKRSKYTILLLVILHYLLKNNME